MSKYNAPWYINQFPKQVVCRLLCRKRKREREREGGRNEINVVLHMYMRAFSPMRVESQLSCSGMVKL